MLFFDRTSKKSATGIRQDTADSSSRMRTLTEADNHPCRRLVANHFECFRFQLSGRRPMERSVRVSRPQLVCVLADNSGSMRGAKAEAATRGIREMLMQCQMKGPSGRHRSYFRFILIRFGSHAVLDSSCNMKPVREIDPDTIEIRGDGGGTNITEALEKVRDGLEKYMVEVVGPHPERNRHPVPVVLLFSDGHNGGSCPLGVADCIKSMNIDGDPITIAAASVSVAGTMPADGNLLRQIASPGCYINVDRPELLTEFLAQVGSSAAMSPTDVAEIAAPLDRPRIETSAVSSLPGPSHNDGGRRRRSRKGRKSKSNRGGSARTIVVRDGSQPSNGCYGAGD